MWRVFGFGHSFHVECIIPNISKCKICEETLLERLEELTEKARQAVFIIDDGSSSDEDEEADDDDGVEGEEVNASSSADDDDANLATENRIIRWRRVPQQGRRIVNRNLELAKANCSHAIIHVL